MILSGQTIRRRGIISPMLERTKQNGMTYGLGPAGYDIRVRERIILKSPKGVFSLGSSIEHFKMPDDVMGLVKDKSTWARRGVAVQNTVIEPGWRGHLTLEVSLHCDGYIRIEEGSPIAQIIFMALDAPANQPYDGKYQDQPSRPVEAILERS